MTPLEKIKSIKLPFAELMGVTIVEAEKDRVVARMLVRPDLCTLHHTIHGGAVQDLVFTALTDTRFYGLNYNIPSLCFGASGAAMHGFNEYVDLDSLRKSTKAAALFIAEWCGVEKV